jgi:hypothetical protein
MVLKIIEVCSVGKRRLAQLAKPMKAAAGGCSPIALCSRQDLADDFFIGEKKSAGIRQYQEFGLPDAELPGKARQGGRCLI